MAESTAATWVPRLDRASAVAILAALPCMLHALALAEAAMAVSGLCLLGRSALLRDWSWAGSWWFRLALVGWVWLVLCSLPGIGQGGRYSLDEAIVAIRYPLFAAALERQLTREAWLRLWLWRVVAACTAYIALQAYLQAAVGVNLWGDPRWPDGSLTGPFDKPRAGPPLAHLLYPALLPPLGVLLGRRSVRAWVGAAVLMFAGLAAVVLIGQRMPLLLSLLGLLVSAGLMRELRKPALLAVTAAAVLLAASAVVEKPTFYRLVTKFSAQMEHFPSSPYGLLAARAVAMTEQGPWTGRGFAGFRTGCAEPRYFHGWSWPGNPADDGGGLAGCNLHPHNYYLQAVTDSGLPGLVLYAALAVVWLCILGRGLWQRPEPLRVGLFVAALIQLWPIASTTSAYAVEITGVFTLLLGYGLAEARLAAQRS